MSPSLHEICLHYVPSLLRTILEPFIIPALLLAYIPQYINIARHGTAGISPTWILCLCLFSTIQLASRLVNTNGYFAVNCILHRKEIHGWQAFGALVGFFEVAGQWLCAILLLCFFVKFRSPATDDVDTRQGERATLINRLPVVTEMPSHRIIATVSTHAVAFLSPAITLLVLPLAETSRGLTNAGLIQIFLMRSFHWICIVLGLVHVLALCGFQIKQARSMPEAPGISLVAIKLQVLVLLVLAVLQAFRPVYPNQKWESKVSDWYIENGNVAVNYFIMVLGHAIDLGLRVYSRRHGH